MEERCKVAHAKLLAGTCPWCGRAVVNGRVEGETELRVAPMSVLVDVAVHEIASLMRMVLDIGPLKCQRAARYVAEVAAELVAIHDAASFHGGVRPDNIFIDETRTARLGGAMFSSVGDVAIESPLIEELADASGLADYLAPEQALNSASVDQRSDIYCLGCTLYFLLIGRPPFPDGTISERLLKLQTEMPESIGTLRPDVPVGLIRICEKMLAKKPIDRFQTATEVAEALAALH